MLVQCLALMAKYTGNRMAVHLNKIITDLSKIWKTLPQDQSSDDNNELSEACLNTIESLIKRCPNEVEPFVAAIWSDCMNLCTYDPNFNYDEDDDA